MHLQKIIQLVKLFILIQHLKYVMIEYYFVIELENKVFKWNI